MLTERERERYLRQIPLIGEEGQERLQKSSILVAGAGGLGSPVALYLAASGVGHIRIVDRDRVERSNLNRQVLHTESDIGDPKVLSAAEKLRAVNPDICIEPLFLAVKEENASRIARGMDLLIDALDNYGSRYILNRVSLREGIPLIHAAVSGYTGQMAVIIPKETPCLRCIIPYPPPANEPPVLGVTAGIMGLLQANEAIKYVIGEESPNRYVLLIWDGRSGRLESLPVEKDPACPECATEGTKTA